MNKIAWYTYKIYDVIWTGKNFTFDNKKKLNITNNEKKYTVMLVCRKYSSLKHTAGTILITRAVGFNWRPSSLSLSQSLSLWGPKGLIVRALTPLTASILLCFLTYRNQRGRMQQLWTQYTITIYQSTVMTIWQFISFLLFSQKHDFFKRCSRHIKFVKFHIW